MNVILYNRDQMVKINDCDKLKVNTYKDYNVRDATHSRSRRDEQLCDRAFAVAFHDSLHVKETRCCFQ